jgi:hypothetical protein
MRDYTRDELLQLTAARYLASGFADRRGKPLEALQTTFATASATQFLAAELSPQELAFTYEALKQTLPLHAGSPPARSKAAVDEALEIVRAMIRQPNHPRLEQWLRECSQAVKKEADLEALLGHFMAVLRQYTVIAASVSS